MIIINDDRLWKEFNAFIKDRKPKDSEEFERLMDEFMLQYNESIVSEKDSAPKDVYDYLELAEGAPTNKKMTYLKKALELEPENIDARMMMAEASSKGVVDYMNKITDIIKDAEGDLRSKGIFDESKGEFWSVSETRPYMRARFTLYQLLMELGMFRRSIAEGEEMLELCVDDNLGVRCGLMHMYVFLEDETCALDLFDRYEIDSAMMLMPLSILYYKLGDLKTSAEYLKRLSSNCPGLKKFLTAAEKGDLDDYFSGMDSFGYQPFTVQEIVTEIAEFDFLFESVPCYFDWARRAL